MYKRLLVPVISLLVAGISIYLFASGTDKQAPLQYFRIGTGSTAGTYFAIGEAIAGIISMPPGAPACSPTGPCGVPGLVAVAQATAGSLYNINAVARGHLESALAQGDLVHQSYYGNNRAAGGQWHNKLRVIANLYPESVHLVVRRGSGITRVPELRGKRVSLDKGGSGTYAEAIAILRVFGLAESDIKARFLDQNEAAEAMIAGKLDAFFFVGGYPAPGITDLAARGVIELAPVAGAPIRRMITRSPFFLETTIPAGSYPGLGAVKTLSVGAQWIVNADVPDDLVYALTKALWNPANLKILAASHPQGRLIRLETALDGVSTQLHPGAERYYLETALTEIATPAATP